MCSRLTGHLRKGSVPEPQGRLGEEELGFFTSLAASRTKKALQIQKEGSDLGQENTLVATSIQGNLPLASVPMQKDHRQGKGKNSGSPWASLRASRSSEPLGTLTREVLSHDDRPVLPSGKLRTGEVARGREASKTQTVLVSFLPP